MNEGRRLKPHTSGLELSAGGGFTRRKAVVLLLAVAGGLAACGSSAHLDASPQQARRAERRLQPISVPAFVDELHERTFWWFWDVADPATGLVPDRWPTPSFSSVAAIGFALTAYAVGAERGWVSRADAANRVQLTLQYLAEAPQGPDATGTAGYRGFFYHFLDMATGTRFGQVELSTVDTALLLSGALLCQEYFAGEDATEAEIRALADQLYERVDWAWAQPRPPAITMGWYPETGFHHLDWRGFNEAMLVYILALGSPTHPVAPEAWEEWTRSYRWGSFYGHEHLGFAPLFGHQYSHVWVDFRGIQDAYMRSVGLDYFENSRRATLAQRDYAIDNPNRFRGYDRDVWGLSACDGPIDATLLVDGRNVRFFTYAARGASYTEVRDDGTITPTAVASSLPFAPDVVIRALRAMRERYGDHLYGDYGFLDAFNPSFRFTDQALRHGHVVPGVGWFDDDYLGIDQGPIVAMIENYRSGLVWKMMRSSQPVRRGLQRAGFTGGWLDGSGP